MVNPNTLLIAGHARLPQGMAAKSVFDTLTITAEVDRKYGVIVEASCTLATDQARAFIGHILKGISLNEDMEYATKLITDNYRGKATNALIAAFKDLHVHFQQYRNEVY
ncbi:DUF3870 domain-containing protein [Alkalihalobacillus deserti]|uniref:DUF3870 domain-containing protein n=1 Tax=Alkalihalobacillus deserti TaxID=2879466 RepID=UPI001D1334F2|nr:DUF3870 domain-containing protein [Alkalihalobacillus deserti]